MTMTNAEKVRENQSRRDAKRRGLLLIKSTQRDPKKFDHGRYLLMPDVPKYQVRGGGEEVAGLFLGGFGQTLDQIEETLNQPVAAAAPKRRKRKNVSPLEVADQLHEVHLAYSGHLTESEEQAFETVRRALNSVAEVVGTS